MKGPAELRVLDMKSTAGEEMPDDFGDLNHLVELLLLNCNSLTEPPEISGELYNLMVFRSQKCLKSEGAVQQFCAVVKSGGSRSRAMSYWRQGFLRSFGLLKKVWTLHMQMSKMSKLPNCFKELTSLTYLKMQLSLNLVHVHALACAPSRAWCWWLPKVDGGFGCEKFHSFD